VVDLVDVDLTGMVDMHVHSAPDVWQRKMDDLELAQQAAARGMRAILLKSHWTLTADRACLVQQVVPDLRVFGGLALNNSVGGFNPIAVEAALRMGAVEIWMPTLSSAAQSEGRVGPGLTVFEDDHLNLRMGVLDILCLIAEHDAILGTGHLSPAEILALVPAAHGLGVRKIVITHPQHPLVGMSPLQQEELRDRFDVLFERCLITTVLGGGHLPFGALVDVIQRVGPDTTVIATDFGQPENLSPVDGLACFVAELRSTGFTEAAIARMGRLNPARLLGI
jgi:hypothetical protein